MKSVDVCLSDIEARVEQLRQIDLEAPGGCEEALQGSIRLFGATALLKSYLKQIDGLQRRAQEQPMGRPPRLPRHQHAPADIT